MSEISSISTHFLNQPVNSVGGKNSILKPNESLLHPLTADSIAISPQALEKNKISQWVEMLHQMPDISKNVTSPTSLNTTLLAETILKELLP